MTRPRRLVFGLLLGCPLATAACSAAGTPAPGSAAQAYARALQARDVDAVYAMLNHTSQQSVTRAELAAMLETLHADTIAAGPLSAGSMRAVPIAVGFEKPPAVSSQRAQILYADGRRVELVLEADGQYHLLTPLPSLRTPQQTLRVFRRALAARHFSQLVALLSRDTQDKLEKYLSALSDSLEFPDSLDVEIIEDIAVVKTRSGRTITLKQEAGAWKLHDVD